MVKRSSLLIAPEKTTSVAKRPRRQHRSERNRMPTRTIVFEQSEIMKKGASVEFGAKRDPSHSCKSPIEVVHQHHFRTFLLAIACLVFLSSPAFAEEPLPPKVPP